MRLCESFDEFYNIRMNQKSAFIRDDKFLKQKTISFEQIPNQTKLFIDFQNNSVASENFYPSKQIPILEFSKEVLSEYQTDRKDLCNILLTENKRYEAGEKTFQNIEKLRSNDCVAVLTGQQAGLFSGPIYTICKALSAIKLADELSKQGINAVPVFWIASEDHDFAEIRSTDFIGKNEQLFEITSEQKTENTDSPIGFIEIDGTINDSINALFDKLAETEFTANIEQLLGETYREGETYSSSFGKLLAKIFRDYGLIFVSPLSKELRRLCSPIYKNAIENTENINDGLLNRNDELQKADYHSQVLVKESFFPFFYIDDAKKRNPLRFDKKTNTIRSQNSEYEFTKNELSEIAENSPASLSPNALLRPVVQDFLFPTVCYFGGGAEIAYFAQNSVIYETLKRPVTPIRHRSSVTMIEGKHRRTLNKYDLEFKDLFAGKEEILAGIIDKFINPEMSELFVETDDVINKQLDKLNRQLKNIEPTLADNLENRRKKISWHIETLKKKFHRAETLKNEVINRRIESLFTNILPQNTLQERSVNVLYFLNKYGENFIEWIYEAVETDEKKHQIIIF